MVQKEQWHVILYNGTNVENKKIQEEYIYKTLKRAQQKKQELKNKFEKMALGDARVKIWVAIEKEIYHE
jgi:hypothetical protein